MDYMMSLVSSDGSYETKLFYVDKEGEIATADDLKCTTAGKGIVLKNAAGTVTKRVRLNNAGDGLLYEDE